MSQDSFLMSWIKRFTRTESEESKSSKQNLTEEEFHKLCKAFYQTTTEMHLTPNQTMEALEMSMSVIMSIAINYFEDPIDVKRMFVRTFDASMYRVEHRSSFH